MKRFFTFLIVIGIMIGIFIVWKNIKNEESINEELNSEEAEVYIDELNFPLISLDTINPVLTKNKQVSDILKLMYEPLMDWNEKNQLEPILATEWNEKDDLTWIIKINTNAKWHDGNNLKPEDIIFTYQTIALEDSVYKENVKNIVSIEKIDYNAIQINLSEKDIELIYKLTFPIISQDYFENYSLIENETFKGMGTGPYRFDAIDENSGVALLVENQQWWKQEEIKLKKIYLYPCATYGEAMKAFKSTTIDVITTSMTSWQKKFGAIGMNNYSYESSEFETVIPNAENILLQDKSVRRMILAGINAENIVELVYQGNGKVSDYPIPSASYLNFYDNEKNYDIEKAKQLLINAGWKYDNNNWEKEINGRRYTLDFDLLVNNETEEKVEVANLIKENLQEIGVTINVIQVNEEEYQKRLENDNFELALATLYLDNDRDILELVKSTSVYNYANYKNDSMDLLVDEVNKENSESAWKQMQELYKNECPYIGMYYLCNQLLTNKSVKGMIQPTSWNPYHKVIGWCK